MLYTYILSTAATVKLRNLNKHFWTPAGKAMRKLSNIYATFGLDAVSASLHTRPSSPTAWQSYANADSL